MQTREEQKKMELAIYQTSIVGHELRTPLLSSKLLLQTIIDAITNFLIKYNKQVSKLEKSLKYGQLILSQMNIMESFIEDILNLRQIQTNVFSQNREVFDLHHSFEFIKQMFEPLIKAKKIELILTDNSVDRQIPKHVKGDQRRMQQILINLVKNAIKFSKVKGQIEIKRDYCYENGLLIVEVKD